MFRRLFALVVLFGLIGAGLYYWKFQQRGFPATLAPTKELGEVGRQLKDTATTGRVRAAFELNRSLKPCPIDVSTEDGIVTLRGSVQRMELREMAEHVAGAVPDVRQVVNHLRVSPGTEAPKGTERSIGESLDDRALDVQVRLAFSLRRELKGTDIEVSAFRREVTLSGEVDTESQRHLAVEVARETADVGSVVDRIRLRGQDATGPAGGREAAERALAANANLAPYRLEVHEEGHRIVLRGRVRTGAEKDLAGLVARDAAGHPVENAIEVEP